MIDFILLETEEKPFYRPEQKVDLFDLLFCKDDFSVIDGQIQLPRKAQTIDNLK